MSTKVTTGSRRPERLIEIFPKDIPAMMLAGANLQELSEEWIFRRRYMDMAEFKEVKAKAGTEGKGFRKTASQHSSTRGRGGEYVTGSGFTAVLGRDCWYGIQRCISGDISLNLNWLDRGKIIRKQRGKQNE